MSNWAGGVLTAAGRTLQAKVEAGTTALILTKIKLGDGTEGMDAVDNLTDLVGPKAVLGISSSVADGDHATITGVMLSTQLQAGFWCREWGLFATDPDVGEILYMVTIDAQPEWLPASTAAAQVSATYAMNIAVANSTNIEVQIDPAGLVDVEMLQSYMGLAKRSAAVALGDTAMLEAIPPSYYLECTTGGITGATAPVITPPVTAGDTITDGTVVWTIRQCLPTSGGTLALNATFLGQRLVQIVGGDDANKNPMIRLYGGTYSETSAGAAQITAAKADSTDLAVLLLEPSGNLTLKKPNQGIYDLGGSAIVAKSLGVNSYIKRADGLIMQWGSIQVPSANTNVTIDLPISFTSAFRFVALPYHNGSINTYPVVINVYQTSSSVTIKSSIAISQAVEWLAIGC